MSAIAQKSMSPAQAVDQTRTSNRRRQRRRRRGIGQSVHARRGLPAARRTGHEGCGGDARVVYEVFGMFRIQGFNIQPAAVEQFGAIAIEHGNWSATFQPKDGSSAKAGGGTYPTGTSSSLMEASESSATCSTACLREHHERTGQPADRRGFVCGLRARRFGSAIERAR